MRLTAAGWWHSVFVSLVMLTACVRHPLGAAPAGPGPVAPSATTDGSRGPGVAVTEPRELGTQPAPSEVMPTPTAQATPKVAPVVFPEFPVVFLGDPTAAEVLTHDLIAFVSDRPGGIGGFDVYLYDRTDETVLLLPGANTAADEFNPSLSHGNHWLVYQSRATGNYDIVMYDLVSRLVNTLPNLNTPSFQANPTINADGTVIAYTNRIGLRDLLQIYDLRTHTKWIPAPVTQLGTQILSPCISPDGTKVAFVTPVEKMGTDIFIYDLVTAMVLHAPYINTPADEDEPVLSTDNRFLVYSTNVGAGGDRDIKLVDFWSGFIDNLQLLNTSGSDATPSYLGLRGNQILFVSNRAGDGGMQMYIYYQSTGQVDTVPMSHLIGYTDTFSPP